SITGSQHTQNEGQNDGHLKVPEQHSNYTPANPVVVDNVVSLQTLLAHLNHIIRFTNIHHKDQNLFLQYLARAEYRYIIWLNLLDQHRPPPDSIPMPPLDVALFWCAHITNVLAYKEDLIRLYGEHMLAYNFPLLHLDAINSEGDDYVDADSIRTWQSFSNEPYNLKFDDDRPFLLNCPFCMKENRIDA
ncbi:4360_t:CDS:2, partial [Acaulospora colombiana]